MKNSLGILLISIFLLFSGCGESTIPWGNNLEGKWKGTITEKGEPVSVELELRKKQDTFEGTLTIVSAASEDVKPGRQFPVVQVERNGSQLKFIVQVTDQVDEDAVSFDLQIEGDKLTGFAQEMREGSDKLPTSFEKLE